MATVSPHAAPAAPADAAGCDENFAFAGAMVDALAGAGVEHVCICPGSRSAPLAATAARCPRLRSTVHLDERSAGFFALGLARTLRRPVAVICSSGTAAANLLPPVVEAHRACAPLILLTADRPPELRDFGAPQTIRQPGLFHRHVRFEADAATPGGPAAAPAYARALGVRAVAEAVGPPAGPVHLNLPFREPLHPTGPSWAVPPPDPAGGPGVRRHVRGPRLPDPGVVGELAGWVAEGPGVVLAGPLDAEPTLARAVAGVSRASGWPVFAESTSGLRAGTAASGLEPVRHPEALARAARVHADLRPERVLQLGPTPTGRALQALPGFATRGFAIADGEERAADPLHRAWRVVGADPGRLLGELAARLSAGGAPSASTRAWRRRLREADAAAEAAVAGCLARTSRFGEAQVLRALARALPDGAALFASNSLPVRASDAWLPPRAGPLRVLANRGANGIDGIPSSALGVAAAGSHRPVVLLTGDVALAHDVGGLAALRRLRELRLVVIVLDNGGGGIFDRLPIAELGEAVAFGRCFRTPPELPLREVAALAGMAFAEAPDALRLGEALGAAIGQAAGSPGRSTLVRVPIDPAESLAAQRELEAAADEAVGSVLAGRGRSPA